MFDSSKIKKYFKNQKPLENYENLNNYQYEDPYFPPNECSLLAKTDDGCLIGDNFKIDTINVNNIEWKSANYIFDGLFNLFDNKIECNDIKQGSLGNCYFLSALAALTEFPNLIFSIFKTKKKNTCGYYEVCLFIEGEWQIVIVDDYFPVFKNKKTLYFSKPNGKELWAILLEKAWAKVNGGYRNTISGKENDALSALTSFPSQRYNASSMSKDELWNLILQSDKSNNVMCATTINEESIKNQGLVPLHAYTLVGALILEDKEYKINYKLVKIRNPWGKKEWNGKWSDNCNNWKNENFKKLANYGKCDDDGLFYMEFDDFIIYYSHVTVCALMSDSNIKFLKYKLDKNNNDPKVYNINIRSEKVTFGISVVDRHWRYTRELKKEENKCPIYVLLAKVENNNELTFVDGCFGDNISVDLIKNLTNGIYIFWVWNDYNNSFKKYDNNEKKTIKITLTSTDKFYAKEQAYDPEFKVLKKLIHTTICKENNVNCNSNFSKIENMFKDTGFGYRIMFNNTDKPVEWTHDTGKCINFELIPSCSKFINKDNKFVCIVEPNTCKFIIGNRLRCTGKYWFNVPATYKKFTGNEDTCHNNNLDQDFFNIFVMNTQDILEINEDYYDFTSSNMTNDQPSFEQDDIGKLGYSNLRDIYSIYFKKLDLIEIEDNNENLSWVYKDFSNAFYIGQLNKKLKRHGKGLLQFKNGSGYYGNWKDDKKNGFGVSYGSDFVKYYEGNYINNKLNGNCIAYISNGDKIEAEYTNDIKNGKGTYFWNNGMRWEGQFKNNMMHGKGICYKNDGKSFIAEYNNGKQINKN